jgi:hypothetical protein
MLIMGGLEIWYELRLPIVYPLVLWYGNSKSYIAGSWMCIGNLRCPDFMCGILLGKGAERVNRYLMWYIP